ncbi:MAG: protein phosphatase 2C domain-containing protein [Blautia sp.]|nr:protein phosphatase 2C domain-containing protein [Blautia sp.]
MEFHVYRKTGSYHKRHQLPCQDVVRSGRKGRYGIITAADGVSSSVSGKEGAELACEAFEDFVKREGSALFKYKKEKLAYLLIEHILYFIEKKISETTGIKDRKEMEKRLPDYACTFLAVCMDNATDEAVILHLGDGAVYSFFGGRERRILSEDLFSDTPCFVTTQDACRMMKVEKRVLKKGETIFLCTDGLEDAFSSHGEEGKRLKEAAVHRKLSVLNRIIDHADWADDVSYAMLTNTGEISMAAFLPPFLPAPCM